MRRATAVALALLLVAILAAMTVQLLAARGL